MSYEEVTLYSYSRNCRK